MQHKEETLEGVKQHVLRVYNCAPRAFNYTINSRGPDSSDGGNLILLRQRKKFNVTFRQEPEIQFHNKKGRLFCDLSNYMGSSRKMQS